MSDVEAALTDGATLVHEGWSGYSASEDVVRRDNDASRSTIVKGDVDAALASADEVVKEPLRRRHVPRRADRAARGDRPVAGRPGHRLVVDPGALHRPLGRRETLELPESHVRIIVPHLGGGFGGKCEFHFEAHVAALARAAGRPVRLVFSRSEEFIAPDHRREGQVIELETGVMRDGTIVARRGRLILDNGAYSADAPFIPQIAAMHAVGPYRIPNVSIDAEPGVHEHDAVGVGARAHCAAGVLGRRAAHGLRRGGDRHGSRRAAPQEHPEGGRRRPATSQVLEPIGAAETLERAVELIGYGRDLPDGEAIGVGCGWWPSFGGPSGAYMKLNGDGSGTIITGAQECGTGAVMALPLLAAEELGMRPDDFSIVYQDTDAGPWDGGASGSQTTFNNGRAVIEAAREVREQLLELAEEELEASREDLELVDGVARVKGSPTVRPDRLPGREGPGRPAAPRQGLRLAAADTRRRRVRLRRPPGLETFAAPTFITHAVRVRVDRETGVVPRARGGGVARLRRHPQPGRRRGPGRGRRRHGHRAWRLLEGSIVGEDGRQQNPHLLDYKLQTRPTRRRSRSRSSTRRPRRRPEGLEGHRRAAVRAHAGRDRETRSPR